MLKVMTYNIQHGIDHLHRLKTKELIVDLDKVIDVIKSINPDILTLNEVYNAPEFGNQAMAIANKLGYYYYFGSAGTCCAGKDSTYRVFVGKSDDIAGPYRGKNNQNRWIFLIISFRQRIHYSLTVKTILFKKILFTSFPGVSHMTNVKSPKHIGTKIFSQN